MFTRQRQRVLGEIYLWPKTGGGAVSSTCFTFIDKGPKEYATGLCGQTRNGSYTFCVIFQCIRSCNNRMDPSNFLSFSINSFSYQTLFLKNKKTLLDRAIYVFRAVRTNAFQLFSAIRRLRAMDPKEIARGKHLRGVLRTRVYVCIYQYIHIGKITARI